MVSRSRRLCSGGFRGSIRTIATLMLLAIIQNPILPGIHRSENAGDPTICPCGCDRIEGDCCCTEPRTSRFEFGCRNGDDPNAPLENSSSSKIIGPPDVIGLIAPVPAPSGIEEATNRFVGPDTPPEIPPPRV